MPDQGDVGLRFAAMYGLADHLKKMLQEGCDKAGGDASGGVMPPLRSLSGKAL